MIGKIKFRLIKNYKLRATRKKFQAWHSRYRQFSAVSTSETNWHDIASDQTFVFNEMGDLSSYVLTSQCLDELLEIILNHPGQKTDDVSAQVDEHVYNMF